jgi:hypothetical protein
VTIDKENTTIVDGAGEKKAVDDRVAVINKLKLLKQLQTTTKKSFKKDLLSLLVVLLFFMLVLQLNQK